jgi:hypothetical protein
MPTLPGADRRQSLAPPRDRFGESHASRPDSAVDESDTLILMSAAVGPHMAMSTSDGPSTTPTMIGRRTSRKSPKAAALEQTRRRSHAKGGKPGSPNPFRRQSSLRSRSRTGTSARKTVTKMDIFFTAALAVSRFYGTVCRRRRAVLVERARNRAAYVIQCLWRRELCRRRVRHIDAAIKIATLLRRRLQRLVDRRHRAAVKIQALIRGYLTRRRTERRLRLQWVGSFDRVLMRKVHVMRARTELKRRREHLDARHLILSQFMIEYYRVRREEKLAWSRIAAHPLMQTLAKRYYRHEADGMQQEQDDYWDAVYERNSAVLRSQQEAADASKFTQENLRRALALQTSDDRGTPHSRTGGRTSSRPDSGSFPQPTVVTNNIETDEDVDDEEPTVLYDVPSPKPPLAVPYGGGRGRSRGRGNGTPVSRSLRESMNLPNPRSPSVSFPSIDVHQNDAMIEILSTSLIMNGASPLGVPSAATNAFPSSNAAHHSLQDSPVEAGGSGLARATVDFGASSLTQRPPVAPGGSIGRSLNPGTAVKPLLTPRHRALVTNYLSEVVTPQPGLSPGGHDNLVPRSFNGSQLLLGSASVAGAMSALPIPMLQSQSMTSASVSLSPRGRPALPVGGFGTSRPPSVSPVQPTAGSDDTRTENEPRLVDGLGFQYGRILEAAEALERYELARQQSLAFSRLRDNCEWSLYILSVAHQVHPLFVPVLFDLFPRWAVKKAAELFSAEQDARRRIQELHDNVPVRPPWDPARQRAMPEAPSVTKPRAHRARRADAPVPAGAGAESAMGLSAPLLHQSMFTSQTSPTKKGNHGDVDLNGTTAGMTGSLSMSLNDFAAFSPSHSDDNRTASIYGETDVDLDDDIGQRRKHRRFSQAPGALSVSHTLGTSNGVTFGSHLGSPNSPSLTARRRSSSTHQQLQQPSSGFDRVGTPTGGHLSFPSGSTPNTGRTSPSPQPATGDALPSINRRRSLFRGGTAAGGIMLPTPTAPTTAPLGHGTTRRATKMWGDASEATFRRRVNYDANAVARPVLKRDPSSSDAAASLLAQPSLMHDASSGNYAPRKKAVAFGV